MKREGRFHFVAWVLSHWERRGPVEALPHCQINLTVTGLAFMAVVLRQSQTNRNSWHVSGTFTSMQSRKLPQGIT